MRRPFFYWYRRTAVRLFFLNGTVVETDGRPSLPMAARLFFYNNRKFFYYYLYRRPSVRLNNGNLNNGNLNNGNLNNGNLNNGNLNNGNLKNGTSVRLNNNKFFYFCHI